MINPPRLPPLLVVCPHWANAHAQDVNYAAENKQK